MRRTTLAGFLLLAAPSPVSAQSEDSAAALDTTVLVLVLLLVALAALVMYLNLHRRLNQLAAQQAQLERDGDQLRQQARALDTSLADVQAQKTQIDAELQKTMHAVTQALATVQQTTDQQRRETANSVLALSLLPFAEQQYRAKDLKGALETYNRALALSPYNPAIHYRLGYIHSQRGELDTAEQHLKAALKLDAQFPPAVAAMGYVYRRRAQQDPRGRLRDARLFEAENHLLRALYSAPKLINEDGDSWWCMLGGLYRDRGQFKKAVDAYRKAAQITPYSSYPLIHLALYAGMDEDHEAMLQHFREAERLARAKTLVTPEDYWFHADLLVARLAQGKIQEAEDALNNVLKLLPRDLVYAGPQLLWALEKLAEVMPEGAGHVHDTIQHIRDHLEAGRAAEGGVSLTNQSFTIPFEGGLPALAVHISIQDDLQVVAKTLDLAEPRPAIFILGGAMDMASQEMQDTRPVIEDGLIPYVQKHSIAVIDGGTHSGVMRLMGESRSKHRATFPLIGVAPVNLVRYAGHDNPEGYDLDPGHSHFILTWEGDWGDETDTMVQFAYTLSGQGKLPGLGLVINGGAIVRQEVYRLTITERLKFPMLVLEGSGRFADTLAAACQTGHTDDDELREVIAKGRIELVSVRGGAQALQSRLEEFLKMK